jgi:heat shock protein HtpX
VPAEQHPGTAHLFIIHPVQGGAGDSLFSTHPSTANRVARLEAMAAGAPGARRRASLPNAGIWAPRRRRAGPWG